MRTPIRTLAAMVLPLLLSAISSNAADLKIGVVNIQTVISQSKKGQIATAELKATATKLTTEIETTKSALITLRDEMIDLQEQATDQGLDEATRQDAMASFQEKAKSRNLLLKDIADNEQAAGVELREAQENSLKLLMEQIDAVLDQVAEQEGVDVVVNAQAERPQQARSILYLSSDVSVDLTPHIIAALDAAE